MSLLVSYSITMGRSSCCFICGAVIEDKTKYFKLMAASWFGIYETIADFHDVCLGRELLHKLNKRTEK